MGLIVGSNVCIQKFLHRTSIKLSFFRFFKEIKYLYKSFTSERSIRPSSIIILNGHASRTPSLYVAGRRCHNNLELDFVLMYKLMYNINFFKLFEQFQKLVAFLLPIFGNVDGSWRATSKLQSSTLIQVARRRLKVFQRFSASLVQVGVVQGVLR